MKWTIRLAIGMLLLFPCIASAHPGHVTPHLVQAGGWGSILVCLGFTLAALTPYLIEIIIARSALRDRPAGLLRLAGASVAVVALVLLIGIL